MTNKFNPKIKYYHIILLSCLLSPLIVLNSYYVNNQRAQQKINKEKSKIFTPKEFLRNLDESNSSDTDKVCDRGSEKLKNYYSTGDGSTVDIDESKEIKNENNSEHIKALINMVKGMNGGSDEMTENLTTYAKHLIPVAFFLVVAILSIPGWITCCSCCCANCCCCCCCKNPCCKIPFFVITFTCYALIIGVSIYGLAQSNSVFVGLADTECSLLRFIDEVLEGEKKEGTPKWGGIDNIQKLLTDTKTKLNSIGTETQSDLSTQSTNTTNKKDAFVNALHTHTHNINNGNYYENLGDPSKNYRLDIIDEFGLFTHSNDGTNTIAPEECTVKIWFNVVDEMSKNSQSEMSKAEGDFGQFTGAGDKSKLSSLDDGIQGINDIKNSFSDLKTQISGTIIDYSGTIDEYGKLGFKIVYSILTVLDAALAALMFLFCFCSGKACSTCCFFRCGIKIVLHLLWNILALLMILTFIIGSIFTLVGTLGNDMVSVVSYIVSEENLDVSKNNGEVALLGDAADKINVCINGDGNIEEKLNINLDDLSFLDDLKEIENNIDSLLIGVKELEDDNRFYKEYTEKLETREQYKNLDFSLIAKDRSSKIVVKDALDKLNENANYEKYDFYSQSVIGCDKTGSASNIITINPKNCLENQLESKYSSSTTELKINSEKVQHIVNSVKYANADADSGTEPNIVYSFKKALGLINDAYFDFLDAESTALLFFKRNINEKTRIFDKFVGKKDNFFSFLNCKFIGKNIKVVLKFLGKSLGTDFYSVGICLIIAGCSMAIAIPFTIILIIIINESNSKKK